MKVRLKERKYKFPKGVRNCRKPKMSYHRGRTWDTCNVILPDGEKIRGHLDTTWGRNFYFEIDGRWYSAPVLDFDVSSGLSAALTFDLRKEPDDEGGLSSHLGTGI